MTNFILLYDDQKYIDKLKASLLTTDPTLQIIVSFSIKILIEYRPYVAFIYGDGPSQFTLSPGYP